MSVQIHMSSSVYYLKYNTLYSKLLSKRRFLILNTQHFSGWRAHLVLRAVVQSKLLLSCLMWTTGLGDIYVLSTVTDDHCQISSIVRSVASSTSLGD